MSSKTTVALITIPLIEESPNPTRDAAMRAVLQDGDISETILQSSLNGVSKAAEHYFNYGQSTFTNGLPEGAISYGVASYPNVSQVLTTLLGHAVGIVHASIELPEVDFVAYEYLQANQNLDIATLLIGSPDFAASYDVYFESSNFNGLNQIDIVFKEDAPTPVYVTKTYSIPNLDITGIYYQTVYYAVGDPTFALRYWTYNTALGTYPTLQLNVFETPESTYFPIVPIRTNKVNLRDVPGDLRNTSERMLKFMTISLEDTTDSLIENPDIADIDDVYLMYAVNIQSDVPETMLYLWEYFFDLSFKSKTSKGEFNNYVAMINTANPLPQVANRLEVSDGEARFRYLYNYIDVTLVTGSIGDVGTITRTNIFRADITDFDDTKVEAYWYLLFTEKVLSNSSMVLRKQISATQYVEMDINGLISISWVYGDYVVIRKLEDSILEDNELFLPMDRATLHRMSSQSHIRDAVIYDSLKLVLHAVQVTKLKWYQTGIFKVVLVAAIIIYAAFTFNPAALTLIGLLEAVTISLLIDFLVPYIIEITSEEVAIAIGIIGSVISLASGNLGFPSLPWAESLLTISSAIIREVGEYLDEALQELIQETADYLKSVEDQREELEEASELLDDTHVDPLWITAKPPKILTNETPTDFFRRTIHSTNPGVLSLDAIENYVTGALQLPDTLDLTNNYV